MTSENGRTPNTLTPNHLVQEQSPYLQQHAFNPVEWYPWSEEAFAKARAEQKPIFLSIGYSTCHWCHVMEHESFEDIEVAKFLREHFISIKVDREELPDVDHLYMAAVQAISGSGGWPMSVFLTPELKPFYGGTYFPPKPQYGRPSFMQLLGRIAELWRTDREKLVESSEKLLKAISQTESSEQGTEEDSLDPKVWEEISKRALQYFEKTFDKEEGGFGSAPKFPRPVQFEFLFRSAQRSEKKAAESMALFTLRKMALGGINDHLGGGFHRYSVDKLWRVSHFEKMLYDQAQLVNAYLDAYQITGDHFFGDVAKTICDYVLRDMTHPLGGFYSAEDADSEGVEGTFYVWTRSELEALLGHEDAKIAAEHWGVTEAGNFEHGKNVFFKSQVAQEVSHVGSESAQPGIDAKLEEICKRLFEHRLSRPRPHLDDKILASWNGLMLGSLARAGWVLGMQKYIEGAVRSAEFIWDHLRDEEGQLLHRWRNGEARFAAYLDTYAFLIKGYLELYRATFDPKWLVRSLALQEQQDAKLFDQKAGAYFMSGSRSDLIHRAKPDYDGAEPSGNSVSIDNLRTLAAVSGREEFLKTARRTAKYFAQRLSDHPYAMPLMVAATESLVEPSEQLVFAGDREAISGFADELSMIYRPELTVFLAEDSEPLDPFYRWIASDDLAKGHNPRAYFCRNFVCELPIEKPSLLHDRLTKRGA